MSLNCPSCGQAFNATRPVPAWRKILFAGPFLPSPEGEIASASRVTCPHCFFQLENPEVRFLGMLSARQFYFLLLAFPFVLVAFGLYLIYK